MPSASFETIREISHNLLKLAEAGDWEAATRVAEQLGLELARCPQANAADRIAIMAALQNITAISERAEPARKDIRRLLAAFGQFPKDA